MPDKENKRPIHDPEAVERGVEQRQGERSSNPDRGELVNREPVGDDFSQHRGMDDDMGPHDLEPRLRDYTQSQASNIVRPPVQPDPQQPANTANTGDKHAARTHDRGDHEQPDADADPEEIKRRGRENTQAE